MKVVLAGTENYPHLKSAVMAGVKNVLFSYYHLKKKTDSVNAITFDEVNKYGCESICDSGLFTLMFGAGKGGNYDFDFMKQYARDYIIAAKKFPLNQVSIVECDVHKLLGMKAVYELRKLFEDSGMNVIYTWHREEGIDGLYAMAEKYDYIAISVPELRILFKGTDYRYQDGVKDLLKKLRANVKKFPKIHLLGNTVQETMETQFAYSCDSTSWLAGARYGRGLIFDGRNLKACSIREEKFIGAKMHLVKSKPEIQEYIDSMNTPAKKEYTAVVTTSAWSYKRYQDWLDRHYKWVGAHGD